MKQLGAESSRFGKYRLLASLGHGGMADVFLAAAMGPAGFSKLQVIKRLRRSLAEDGEFLQMFLDEARLAARLNHSNIVQTNEVGEESGYHYIAMEFLDGQPLNRVLRHVLPGQMAQQDVITVLCDALTGLHYAHELRDYDGTPLGVVHRDVSPQNVFVTYDGITKLVDFGVAKATNRSTQTRAGMVKGKIQYMAPEQARSDYVDRRADVFAMGVVLWEVLAQRRMWSDMTEVQIIGQVLQGNIPDLERAASIPRELVAVTRKALAADPNQRWSSALEMRDALAGYLDRRGGRPTPDRLGARLRDVFANRRAELQSVIDCQLAQLEQSGTAALETTDIAAYRQDRAPSSTPASRSTSILAVPRSMAPTRSRWVDRGITTGGLVAAGLIGAVIARLVLNPPSQALIQAPAPVLSAPSSVLAKPLPSTSAIPASNARSIELTLSVHPRSATLSLDGALLPENPYRGRFPQDDAPHRLKAEARGYAPSSRIVRFDQDQNITLTLTSARSSTSASASGRRGVVEAAPPATAKPPPSPRPDAVLEAPGRRELRSLDTSYPWK